MKHKGLSRNFTINLALTLILLSFLVLIQQEGQKIFGKSTSGWYLDEAWELEQVGTMGLSNSGELSVYDGTAIVSYDLYGNQVTEVLISPADLEMINLSQEVERPYVLPGEWTFRGDTLLLLTDEKKSSGESIILFNKNGRSEFFLPVNEYIALAHLAEAGIYVNALGIDGSMVEKSSFIDSTGEIVWENSHPESTVLALCGSSGGWATVSWNRRDAEFVINLYTNEGLLGSTSLERIPRNFWLDSQGTLWVYLSERNLHINSVSGKHVASINMTTTTADVHGVYITEESVAVTTFTNSIAGKKALGLTFYSHGGSLLYSYIMDSVPLHVDTVGNNIFVVFGDKIQIFNSNGRLVDELKSSQAIVWAQTFDEGLVFMTSDNYIQRVSSK